MIEVPEKLEEAIEKCKVEQVNTVSVELSFEELVTLRRYSKLYEYNNSLIKEEIGELMDY